ncbi:MAG: GNAT family N-acetyltransferase [Candidatus Dojkabacteria bacterium]
MNSILKVSEEKFDDVFEVISKCSAWMASEHNMNHWSNYYTKAVVLEKLQHSNVYVEYLGTEPVATITISVQAPSYYLNNTDGINGGTLDYTEEFESSKDKNTKALYISALGVIPDQQGTGLASKLLKMAEDEAIRLGCNIVRFDSRMSFKPVINFYLAKGYKKVGVMDDEGEEYGLFEKEILEA